MTKRAIGLAAGALAFGLAGYAALDAYDRVPGVLTQASGAGRVDAVVSPVAGPSPLTTLSKDAARPQVPQLRAKLAPLLRAKALGPSVGVSIRDALTGQELLTQDETAPRLMASTQKLLAAAAITSVLRPDTRLTTKVVAGNSATDLILVSGGDTMLAAGAGLPNAVEGRAGLQDLARQVAASLRDAGQLGKVTLRLDDTYSAGPSMAPTWDRRDLAAGYTQTVRMIGLAGQRPMPFKPSPAVPPKNVLQAFAEQLKRVGLDVTADLSPDQWSTPAPAGARMLGSVSSAPVGDILALALSDSDDALTENLARQAAVRAGSGTTFAAVAEWESAALTGLGIDLTGVKLLDASGLARGQTATVKAISQVIQLGVSGKDAGMRRTLAALPVSGLTGTLYERFNVGSSIQAAGRVQAKTGTLTGVSSLAGTVLTADNRLLTFVIAADKASENTLEARAALDAAIAKVAACGCR